MSNQLFFCVCYHFQQQGFKQNVDYNIVDIMVVKLTMVFKGKYFVMM